jgi:hypothetical protein
MSLKPPLNCPPDYSVLVFRLSECKKASVVKGVTTLSSLNLEPLAIPIQEHSEGTLILKAGTEKLLDISEIAEYGLSAESYSFSVSDVSYLGTGTTGTYSLADENNNEIATLNYTVGATGSTGTFAGAFAAALTGATAINQRVSFNTTSSGSGTFSVSALSAGTKYRHLFAFNKNGASTIYHPGTLVTSSAKYENGRIKYILIYPEFEKVDTTTCGCSDSSGDIYTNKKYLQYANQTEYASTSNPSTRFTVAGTGASNITWSYTGTNIGHIAYSFKAGDIVELKDSSNNLFRAKISSIEGSTITLDAPLNDSSNYVGSFINHTYSLPSPIWSNGGSFIFLSGTTEVNSGDDCFIETVVLKNPHSFNIPIKYMIGK